MGVVGGGGGGVVLLDVAITEVDGGGNIPALMLEMIEDSIELRADS